MIFISFWMIFVYAVDTHELMRVVPVQYKTKEACEIDRRAVEKNGKTYTICRSEPL